MINEHQHKDEDIRAVYNAVVDYHNNLVHMRFTVAGLYLAASGFLVGALFSEHDWCWKTASITILGLVLTAVAWLLEIRTYQLLENLGNTGLQIETMLQIGSLVGFFGLMSKQPIFPKLPFIKCYIRRFPRFVRRVVSHSFGLSLLYLVVGIFWVFVLRYYK